MTRRHRRVCRAPVPRTTQKMQRSLLRLRTARQKTSARFSRFSRPRPACRPGSQDFHFQDSLCKDSPIPNDAPHTQSVLSPPERDGVLPQGALGQQWRRRGRRRVAALGARPGARGRARRARSQSVQGSLSHPVLLCGTAASRSIDFHSSVRPHFFFNPRYSFRSRRPMATISSCRA